MPSPSSRGSDTSEEDVELLPRRRPEAVDEDRDRLAAVDRHVGEDRVDEAVGDPIRRFERAATDAGLSVDAHPDLHLAVRQLEGRPAGGRQGARRKRDAHRPDPARGKLGGASHLGQRATLGGPRAGDLVQEEDAGDASTAMLLALRGGRDVVGAEDRRDLDPVEPGQLGGEVEVHHVAAVVAIDVQDAGATVDRPRHLEHLVGRGRGEDIPDRRAVDEPLAQPADEQRQVAGAAAGRDADLAGHRGDGPDDRSRIAGDPQLRRVGTDESLEHLVDEVDRCVEDLLHR